MKVQLWQVQWGRILLAVILIVFLALTLNLLVDLLVFHLWSNPEQEQMVTQVTFWTPSILSILLTGVSAAWVARRVEREPLLHAFLVGFVAALILFFLSAGFQGEFVLVTLLTTLLTIAADWLGGFLVSRGR